MLTRVHDSATKPSSTKALSIITADDEYVESTGPLIQFVEKESVQRSWVAPAPQVINTLDWTVDPKRQWIFGRTFVLEIVLHL